MKLPNGFGLKWKDAVNAIILSLIANALMIVMNAAEGQFPTLAEFKLGLINTVKYAIIPYLLKNFFTDSVSQARKTISDAKEEGNEAAKPIPPPLTKTPTI